MAVQINQIKPLRREMTREYQAEQPKLTPLAEERLDDDEPPTPPHDFRDLTIEEKRELIDRFATELLLLYLPKSVCKVSDMQRWAKIFSFKIFP